MTELFNEIGMNGGIFYLVILFAIYAFIGWLIESIYRSMTQRRPINAGFLFGPFVPIYGFGAGFIVLMDYALRTWHILPKLAMYGVVLTVVEYAVAVLFETVFRLKLWDYSGNRFNFQGRVCLLFSGFWAALALVFVQFIHPWVSSHVLAVGPSYAHTAGMMLLAYLAADFVFSIISLSAFRTKIAHLYSEYLNLSDVEIEKIFDSFKRLRRAFPNLNSYIDTKITIEFKSRINAFLKTIQDKVIMDMNGRKPLEKEFYETIGDIYRHPEFMKLKRYYHHNSSIYAHVREVAYFTYRISKYLRLDYRSAARGALLHDFFLYDWRNHDAPDLPREKYHGIEHPKIALHNAEKYFPLNDIERDIIVKHMWPLTLVPPRYKESFVVSFADKYLSSKEFFDEFKKQAVKKRARRPLVNKRARGSRKRG
jgi:uncharacterized membrane protein